MTERRGTQSADAATKTCPACAEEVQAAAVVCRFCRYDFTAGSATKAGPPERQHQGSPGRVRILGVFLVLGIAATGAAWGLQIGPFGLSASATLWCQSHPAEVILAGDGLHLLEDTKDSRLLGYTKSSSTEAIPWIDLVGQAAIAARGGIANADLASFIPAWQRRHPADYVRACSAAYPNR
jgi:hypothetical protein